MRSVQSTFESYVKLNKRIPPEMLMRVQTIDDPARLADTIVAHLPTRSSSATARSSSRPTDPAKRLERLYELMQAEIEILQVEKKIRSRVKKQMEKTQKEYYLNEQMQAIQKELGERDEFKNEIQELEEKLKTKRMRKEAARQGQEGAEEAQDDAADERRGDRRAQLHRLDPRPALVREDRRRTTTSSEAEKILDEDHYGLKKVKERILEYLAVQALVEQAARARCSASSARPASARPRSRSRSRARRAASSCACRSAACATRPRSAATAARTSARCPASIIQSLKKAGTNNPVFLLDEVDKMSTDFRGDPAAALLEVLDPEQNHAFNDHYLDLDYDLSDVMFITTANTLSRHPGAAAGPHGDHPAQRLHRVREAEHRGEVPGAAPARRERGLEDVRHRDHRERDPHGHPPLHAGEPACATSSARSAASAARSRARWSRTGKEQARSRSHRAKSVPKYLGVPQVPARARPKSKDEIGLTNGLAYTSFGGAILECEVAVVPGKGKLVITGLLEKGMQERAQAAMSYIRSRAEAARPRRRTSTRRSTSTFTSPSSSARTGRAPA